MDTQLKTGEVRLSMDLQMQSLLHQTLENSVKDFAAEGASGIIIDMRLGRIRAMVSIPSPINKLDFLDHKFRNRNLDPVEVGSVMKLFNVAVALESGYYCSDSIVDARGPMILDKFEINDFMGVDREITLSESLWRSSNIANARVALHLGKKLQKRFLRRIGLLDKIEWMPGCYAYSLTPKKWGETTTATLGYGYGIGITVLHLAKVVFAVTTGKTTSLSMIESPEYQAPKSIFSKETVKNMRKMMREVVTKSHRKSLLIKGCRVGAKTGTANLLIKGKYVEGRNFVTLVAVFPINNPELLIILQMNDPKKEFLKQGRYTTAGNVLSGYMRDIITTIHERRMNVG
jgi:cell division protein FtsI (penicillin-binding protein 3)